MLLLDGFMVVASNNLRDLLTVSSDGAVVSDVAIVNVAVVISKVIMGVNRRKRLRFWLDMPSNYIEISCQGSLRLRRLKEHVLFSLVIHVMIELIVTVDVRVAWVEHSGCM